MILSMAAPESWQPRTLRSRWAILIFENFNCDRGISKGFLCRIGFLWNLRGFLNNLSAREAVTS